MSRSDTTLIAIGGGPSQPAILEHFFERLAPISDPRVTAVMTVATNDEDGMTTGYNSLF